MKHRVLLGGLLWGGALALVLFLSSGAGARTGVARLWRFATGSRQRFRAIVPRGARLKLGQHVIGPRGNHMGLVGCVESIHSGPGGSQIAILVFDPEQKLVRRGSDLRLVDARGDMTWALHAVLPKPKLDEISRLLSEFRRGHRRELMDIAQAVAQDFVQEGITSLDRNLAGAVRRHEKEWRAVLDRHRRGLKEDLLPVLKDRLGATARVKLKPVLTEVGKELWNELPIWSVAWRAFADKIPGTRQRFIDEWWQKFLDEKAIPIVKNHETEFLELAEELLIEGAEDPVVRKRMAVIARRLVDDPTFRRLVNVMLHETLIEPFRSDLVFQRLAKNRAVRARFTKLNAAFAPTLREIARVVIEDPKGGLDPDLVQVIRRVFFEKEVSSLILRREPQGVELTMADSPLRVQLLTPGTAEAKLAPREPVEPEAPKQPAAGSILRNPKAAAPQAKPKIAAPQAKPKIAAPQAKPKMSPARPAKSKERKL